MTDSVTAKILSLRAAGASYKEIAGRVGMPLGTVWRRAASAGAARAYESSRERAARDGCAASQTEAQLDLAMAWGAAMAAELEALRRLVGERRILPMPGGKEWNGEEVVYFVHCVDGATKVGWTRDIRRRLQDLRGASGGKPIELVSAIRGTAETERSLHAEHASRRVLHEWFALDQEHIPPTDFAVGPLNDAARRGSFKRSCLHCGAPFVARVACQTHCSHRCGRRRWFSENMAKNLVRFDVVALRECVSCGKEFELEHGNRKRCDSCRRSRPR